MSVKPSLLCWKFSSNVRDVQEAIFVFVLLVNTAHQSCRWRQDLIHEDENGLFGAELNALSDDIYELADSEICRNQILLLVDGGDVGFLDFFADHLLFGFSQFSARM